jgi:hypothetical protein
MEREKEKNTYVLKRHSEVSFLRRREEEEKGCGREKHERRCRMPLGDGSRSCHHDPSFHRSSNVSGLPTALVLMVISTAALPTAHD